jgi:predicted nucleotidyltransferase
MTPSSQASGAFSTGNRPADETLAGVVGILNLLFPNRILATYVNGSYADGTPVRGSDLDVTVVFRGGIEPEEREQVWDLADNISLFSPIRVDLEGVGEDAALSSGYALKLGGMLMSGEDIKSRIQLPPVEEYRRDKMYGPPLTFMLQVARGREWAAYPLLYPDLEGEFYGYDNNTVDNTRDTKMLVALAGHIATAIVALKTGRFVSSKSQSFRLYRELVNDGWANFLDGIYRICRVKWQYAIPEGEEDREKLRSICRRLLKLENNFLELLHDFILAEIEHGEYLSTLRAVEQLGKVAYRDRAVHRALKAAASSGDAPLQAAAQEALAHIEQARPAPAKA